MAAPPVSCTDLLNSGLQVHCCTHRTCFLGSLYSMAVVGLWTPSAAPDRPLHAGDRCLFACCCPCRHAVLLGPCLPCVVCACCMDGCGAALCYCGRGGRDAPGCWTEKDPRDPAAHSGACCWFEAGAVVPGHLRHALDARVPWGCAYVLCCVSVRAHGGPAGARKPYVDFGGCMPWSSGDGNGNDERDAPLAFVPLPPAGAAGAAAGPVGRGGGGAVVPLSVAAKRESPTSTSTMAARSSAVAVAPPLAASELIGPVAPRPVAVAGSECKPVDPQMDRNAPPPALGDV